MRFVFFLLIHGIQGSTYDHQIQSHDGVLPQGSVQIQEDMRKMKKEKCKCVGLRASDDKMVETKEDAIDECGQKVTGNETLVYVPYVSEVFHRSTECELQWCCKKITVKQADRSKKALNEKVIEVAKSVDGVVNTLMIKVDKVMKRGTSFLQAGWDEMSNNTQYSLAVINMGVSEAAQKVTDQILMCASDPLTQKQRNCGNMWAFSAKMKMATTELEELIDNYTKLLNLVEYRSKDPSIFFKATHVARRTVFPAVTRLRGVGKSAILRTPTALIDAALWIKRQLWRRRMLIYISVMVLMNTATLSGIIMNAMLNTHPETGVLPVVESICGQITTKIICPLVANSVAVGFIAHWFVDQVIMSEAGQKIIEKLLLPFTFLSDGFSALISSVRRSKDEGLSLSRQILGSLKAVNSHSAALAAYMFLYSHVSGIFRLASKVLCTGLTALFTAKDITVNTADAAVNKVIQTAGSYWTDSILWVKDALGVDTEQARAVVANQKRMELLSQSNLIHKVLRLAHTTLGKMQKWQQPMYAGANWVVTTLQKHLDGEGQDLTDFLGDVFQQLQGKWMTSILGAGTATMIAGSSTLQGFFDASKKEVNPYTIKTFIDNEEAEFNTMLVKAREFRPQVKRMVDGRTPTEKVFSSSNRKIKEVKNQVEQFENQWIGL
eukprot:GEMP01023550.1.p1 GENE.GEMP01023550.1~~GEMP01023550.1.p1  ORF type:complete len:664 (+),score=96.42 GEMP01023550.1:271-2262(+)